MRDRDSFLRNSVTYSAAFACRPACDTIAPLLPIRRKERCEAPRESNKRLLPLPSFEAAGKGLPLSRSLLRAAHDDAALLASSAEALVPRRDDGRRTAKRRPSLSARATCESGCGERGDEGE